MSRQQRRAQERKKPMPGTPTPVGTLTSDEVAALRAIEGELQRLVMVHGAMTAQREVVMNNVVRSRGFDPTVEDYFLDLDHGLILQRTREVPELQVIPVEEAAP